MIIHPVNSTFNILLLQTTIFSLLNIVIRNEKRLKKPPKTFVHLLTPLQSIYRIAENAVRQT